MPVVTPRRPSVQQHLDAILLDFGNALEAARAEHCLTVAALARRGGVSARTTTAVRQTTANPRLSTLVALALACGGRLVIRVVPETAR